MRYKAVTLEKDEADFIKFTLGFRVEPRVNYFFELVLEEMEKNGEVERASRHPRLQKYEIEGDLRFVVARSFLSNENDLSFRENLITRSYYFLRRFSVREDEAYGLNASNVVLESVPVVVQELSGIKLRRES